MMVEPTIRDGITELGIFEKSDDAWTTSVDLARVFDKRHDNVIRDIEVIMDSSPSTFVDLNFEATSYKDVKGKKHKCYRMTRKGFTLVAMGFTGKKAMAFKVAYINAFEAMSELIFSRIHTRIGYREMTGAIKEYIGNDKLTYAREADMVNGVVLGMSAKDFREVHNLKQGETPRDAVVRDKLEQLNDAQRINAGLIRAGLDAVERERILRANYNGSR